MRRTKANWKQMLAVDRVHHGDAFRIVPQMPDGSVDLIVCDGPYGVTANKWDRSSNFISHIGFSEHWARGSGELVYEDA